MNECPHCHLKSPASEETGAIQCKSCNGWYYTRPLDELPRLQVCKQCERRFQTLMTDGRCIFCCIPKP